MVGEAKFRNVKKIENVKVKSLLSDNQVKKGWVKKFIKEDVPTEYREIFKKQLYEKKVHKNVFHSYFDKADNTVKIRGIRID